MKKNTHPNYVEIEVTCSCGNKFSTCSTLGKPLHIEVCSECHSFYTGKQQQTGSKAGRAQDFAEKFRGHSIRRKAS